jgi:hypothetical protein
VTEPFGAVQQDVDQVADRVQFGDAAPRLGRELGLMPALPLPEKPCPEQGRGEGDHPHRFAHLDPLVAIRYVRGDHAPHERQAERAEDEQRGSVAPPPSLGVHSSDHRTIVLLASPA